MGPGAVRGRVDGDGSLGGRVRGWVGTRGFVWGSDDRGGRVKEGVGGYVGGRVI